MLVASADDPWYLDWWRNGAESRVARDDGHSEPCRISVSTRNRSSYHLWSLHFLLGLAVPDHTGKLSEQEKAYALQWLNKHAKQDFACPVCGSRNWVVAEHVTQTIRFGADALSGATYPLVLFVSIPCGFVMPFSSALMGFQPPPPPPFTQGGLQPTQASPVNAMLLPNGGRR